jgi:hypothetical protein
MLVVLTEVMWVEVKQLNLIGACGQVIGDQSTARAGTSIQYLHK